MAKFIQSLKAPSYVLLVMWLVQALQMLTQSQLGWLGVYPRHQVGIKGILTAPFVHSLDLMHLVNNSVPLFVCMALIIFFYRHVAARAILLVYFFTGIGVWLFGRAVWHIGASGVVYGLVAFIFWTGIFRRDTKSIVLALLILLLYSGMFLGILPNQPGISWESHLIGALVGIAVAFLYRNTHYVDEEALEPTVEDYDDETRYFLERDVFDRRQSLDRSNKDWHSNSTY